MTQDILFLSHRMPFPPDRGDKIRSHHFLKKLATVAPVHVATFADDDRDMAEEVELAAVAQTYCLVRRTKPLALAGLQALARGAPVSLTAFYNAQIAEFVSQAIARHSIETIYVFSGQMGQYVPPDFAGRVVADFVDVDSVKFEAYGESHRGLRGAFEAREGRLLREAEVCLARRADVSLLISAEEAALFRARLDPSDRVACDVRVVGNGIDSAHFDPGKVRPRGELVDLPQPRLIFTGQMDYAPNIAAVRRTVERVMPGVLTSFPKASFHVVGRNPTDAVIALDGLNGCRVWGEVSDVRPFLAAADLAVVALDIARGVQNKVLEAMAMSVPVVLTNAAATGIGAEDGHQFAVADDDEGLARRIIELISHPRLGWSMAVEARRFVVEKLSWPATLAPLPALVGRASGAATRDAA